MRRCVLCWLACLWLGLPLPAMGEEAGRSAPDGGPPDLLTLLYDESDLFISATESAHALNRAPAIASVITARQIHDMGARTLLEALQTLPGIGVMYPDTLAILEAVEVRGLVTEDSEKVLILLNGHRLNWPFIGSAIWLMDEFPLDGVERIEVIRGPGSALYGTGAFVATINIIMRDTGPDSETAATLGAGNANTTRQSLTLRHRRNGARLFGTYTHFDTNGEPQLITGDAGGQSGPTNYWRGSHTGYAHADVDKLGLTAFVTGKRRGTPVGLTGMIDSRSEMILGQALAAATYTTRGERADLTADLQVDQNWHSFAWQLDIPGFADTGNPRVKDRTVTGKLRNRIRMGRGHLLTLGSEASHTRQYDVRHLLDGVDVSATFNHNRDATRRVLALYAQDEWEVGTGSVVTAGVRWDHYSDFGTSLNPRLAYVWSPRASLDVKLLYGRAFRAPSFAELYERNNPVYVGNPDLKPETMDTAEAGLDWRFRPWGQVTAAAFVNRFRNRIVQTVPMTVNSGGADVHGVELELRADWREMRHGYLNWSWNHAEDQQTGKGLPDVPRQRAKAGVNWGLFRERVNANLGLRWAGRQGRPAGDTRPPTKPYTTADAALTSPQRGAGLEWAFTVRNLTDKRVLDPSTQVPGDVPRPGRTWLIEVGYRY